MFPDFESGECRAKVDTVFQLIPVGFPVGFFARPVLRGREGERVSSTVRPLSRCDAAGAGNAEIEHLRAAGGGAEPLEARGQPHVAQHERRRAGRGRR
eukprot:8013280-Pyramimonas_sp.AAC.1